MSNKNKYTIDNSNRLTVKRGRKKLVANGKFGVDGNNRLIYWLNEPAAWRRKYALSDKISFEGDWRLRPDYDLELLFIETENQCLGDSLVLKGKIVSVDNNTLGFEIKGKDKNDQSHIQKRGTTNEV